MERRRDGVEKAASRKCRDHPSFSSTLLDAIYRSIDETDDLGAKKEKGAGRATDLFRSIPVSSKKKQSGGFTRETRRSFSENDQPIIRSCRLPDLTSASSSSSDCSSYGGFSSSEAESVSACLRPIRTSAAPSAPFPRRPDCFRPAPPPPPISISSIGEVKRKKERYSSIRSRMRELKKGRTPASPGARIASFLNSLFAVKSKVSASAGEDSMCSTAPSYSRSCLSKTPTSVGQPAAVKRTVRFCPVSVIVDEDCRPCGQKCMYGGNLLVDPPPPARRVTEMLIKRSQMAEEEEDDDWESDSSSDLFELENLAVIGPYGDELPVYETTHLANYRSSCHGLLL